MITIKCQNYRPKKEDNRSECGRVIAQVRDLSDKEFITYCPSCKSFIKIINKDGRAYMRPVTKDKMFFDNVLRCEQTGYQTVGVA